VWAEKTEIVVVAEDPDLVPKMALGAGVSGTIVAVVLTPLSVLADVVRLAVNSDSGSHPTGGYLVPELIYPASFSIALLPVLPGALAASARARSEARGVPACHVLGWIFHGLAVAGSVTMMALASYHAGHHFHTTLDVAHGPMSITGALGILSSTMMAIDGFVIWKQTRASGTGSASSRNDSLDGHTMILPYLTARGDGLVLGIGGTF
jgi:hypothetical protein